MARQVAEKKDFAFVGGLNTEAGFLTFPENTWLDGDNITPKIDGSVERRTKLDFEQDFQLSAVVSDSNKQIYAFTVNKWDAVGGDGNVNFAIVQQGPTLRFYDTSSASLTPREKSFSLDLNSVRVATSPNVFGTSPISISTGSGNLVVVSADTEPILVKYTAATDSISVFAITLRIRDFAGLDDTLAADTRPAVQTASHHYNLLNQGWDDTKITSYKAFSGLFPSNAQIWIRGKDATNVFSPADLDKVDFGTSLAPKGSFILDVFNRDRTTASGVVGITTEVENLRPVTTAFFAGRAWFAGTSSSTIGSWLLFTRIIDADVKYFQCYQEGDPTAEFTNDLLATDGGVIPIPEAGSIVSLNVLQDSLIVFARNGIWQILGDIQSGFKADAYQVKKLSSFGCISAFSIIEFENTLVFWSNAGIFVFVQDVNSGTVTLQSLSQNKIQTLFSAIPTPAKFFGQGFYNSEDKRIVWLFNDNPNSTIDKFTKNRFLIYDVRLQSFYTYTIASVAAPSPIIVGGIVTVNGGASSINFNVLSGTDIVISNADTVIAGISISAPTARIPKYLTLVPSGGNWALTFSDFINTADAPSKFMDWFSYNNTGAETAQLPYLVTGYQILGDGSKTHQAPYIVTMMKRTETGFDASTNAKNQSSATLQGRWEWSDNASSNKWTVGEEVYRRRNLYVPADTSDTYQDGYPLVVTKTKIRGKGKSLHLKWTSSSGKDMKIVGWSVLYNANTGV